MNLYASITDKIIHLKSIIHQDNHMNFNNKDRQIKTKTSIERKNGNKLVKLRMILYYNSKIGLFFLPNIAKNKRKAILCWLSIDINWFTSLNEG